MTLQLQHVFSGIGMRRGEIQRQPLVDASAVVIAEITQGSYPRPRGFPAKPLRKTVKPSSRNTYHADTATAMRRGYCGYRVVRIVIRRDQCFT